MRASFEPKEAFFLYFVILGFLIGFFIIGLYLGKGFFVEANQQSELVEEMAQDSESVENLSSELDFYENLSTPVDSRPEETPPAESTSTTDRGNLDQSSPVTDDREQSRGNLEESLSVGTGNYTIQVAAFSTEAEAEQTRLRLEAKDFAASIVRPGEVPGDSFYRVWVGRYASIEEAQAAEGKLKAAGFSTFVRKIEG